MIEYVSTYSLRTALIINVTYCACYYCGKFGQSDSRGGIYDTQVDEYITQV